MHSDHNRMLLDIETQQDFFAPGGSCYQREASEVAKRIYRLVDFARREGIPVVSTLLRVRPGERGPLASVPHCVDGTEGEKKLTRTVLARRINLGLRNTTDLPEDIFGTYQQIIFEKRDTDLFAHARAERLITELPPTTFVAFGAGLARSIAQAAIGLRSRGFGVIVAADAVLDLDDPMTEMATRRMDAKGVVFATTEEILRTPKLRRRYVPMRLPNDGGVLETADADAD